MSEPNLPFSILNEDGSCPERYRALLNDADLLAIHDMILFSRHFDRRMMMLQRQGRLGFYMTSTGEESTMIGATFCLKPDDPIFLSYREIGCLLWRKVDLRLIMNQLIGNSRDLCKGRQMPIHFCFREWGFPSVSSPVGTQLPHACGYAYAARELATGQVCLAFLGEGTASEGDFHTALNFAGVFRVPCIYLIRNNGYAISTPEAAQTAAKSLAARAAGYGMPGLQVDGNDLLALVNAMRWAVARARDGEGPTLIEAMTYRMGAHSTADDPSAYRSEEETARWAKVDNLARLEHHVRWRGLYDEARKQEALARHEETVRALIADSECWPPPPLDSLFEDVFEHANAHLLEQREEYLRFLAWKARRRAGEMAEAARG